MGSPTITEVTTTVVDSSSPFGITPLPNAGTGTS
jgi:hypothetical protein